MKQQILLPLLLTISLATALFASGQIGQYFASRDVLVGNWNNSGLSEINFQVQAASGELQTSSPSPINSSSSNSASIPQIKTASFQGYLFDKYLAKHKSPLAGYGQDFVTACQKYGAPSDCTLLIAIGKVETDLCKTDISASQHNCWGFGGSGPNRILYDNFPQAIDEVTRRLMSGYGAEFFSDPEVYELRYCGSHCNRWGDHVQSERLNLNDFFINNGYGKLF